MLIACCWSALPLSLFDVDCQASLRCLFREMNRLGLCMLLLLVQQWCHPQSRNPRVTWWRSTCCQRLFFSYSSLWRSGICQWEQATLPHSCPHCRRVKTLLSGCNYEIKTISLLITTSYIINYLHGWKKICHFKGIIYLVWCLLFHRKENKQVLLLFNLTR